MKKNIIPIFSLFFLVTAVFSSCKKDRKDDGTPDDGIVPNSFNYATSKDVTVAIRLLTNKDQPIKGAVLNITDPADPGRIFMKAVSGDDGYIRGTVNVPSYLDTLVLSPNYVGLINNVKSYIGNKSSINAIIGGEFMASGDVVPERVIPRITAPEGLLSANNAKGAITPLALTLTYGYPSPYSSSSDANVNTSTYPSTLGRPKYLEPTPDVIDAGLLNYVNASLPEGTPLTTSHPLYLATNAPNNLVVTQTSDVWITFVSEGASFLNTLAYYSYDTDNPPNNVNLGGSLGGIDKITMVFPNASGYQSGGGLLAGDKVKLGRFDAGTTIAFVLIQNGWTGTSVNTNATKFYSESKFNPELQSSRKKHSVLLYDDVHKLFLLGFEDTNRESTSDNDFNDLVVYATSNPVTAISGTNVPGIDKGGDSDADGIVDGLDAFPTDATRAFITYSPSINGFSTLAFEDNWPIKGDYDLNDLVVNYRYTFISNAQNGVVEMTGEFLPVAAGANYKNGFGVQLPIPASSVASVTGQSITGSYIQLGSNGVESGQSQAVLIPFDNHENLLKNADGSFQVNSDPNKVKVTPNKVTLNVKFTSPVLSTTLGNAPFNPFLIVDRKRGYEVHLPNTKATDKATASLFGTGDDSSNAGTGRFYLSKENSPWALSFIDSFTYPIETRSIADAYLRFNEWVSSGGTSYKDWYVNTAAGYRNTNNIYTK
ncbi:MAG: LruC domain-containing protein [Pedobacter sp.]|nr:MAG: LruC domain-containing protein [Pedobacter sp.]